jgi:hypothetical protein
MRPFIKAEIDSQNRKGVLKLEKIKKASFNTKSYDDKGLNNLSDSEFEQYHQGMKN